MLFRLCILTALINTGRIIHSKVHVTYALFFFSHSQAVETGTVRTADDFYKATSLIENDFVEFYSQIHHFVVLFGDVTVSRRKRGNIAMYPHLLENRTSTETDGNAAGINKELACPTASKSSSSPLTRSILLLLSSQLCVVLFNLLRR